MCALNLPRGKRAPAFRDIPDEKWADWRWQLSHRLNTVEDFENVLHLTDSEKKALTTPGTFRVMFRLILSP